jgi:hypothetical protein
MDAVSARPEERDRTAIQAKDRRRTPARGDVKGLVAPFRNPVLGDERIDHRVDSPAYGLDITADQQSHLVVLDRKDIGKPPQRFGVVMPQETDPIIPGEQWHGARRIVVVA